MIDFINFSRPETGSFLVDIIFWLVQISTSVTLGVILFTVLLKLITLPFDFMSRASMRKNSLKMEQMRPELEKLQKQYADNKDLYNQKMMALYKKNGYSMFGACLPTILTLVIFIVAINAFTDYSKFQNRSYFYNMSLSYNDVIYSGMELDDKYISRDSDGTLLLDVDKLSGLIPSGEKSFTVDLDNNKYSHDIILSVREEQRTVTDPNTQEQTTITDKYLVVNTTNSYVSYQILYKKDGTFSNIERYLLIPEKLYAPEKDGQIEKHPLASADNNGLKIIKEVDGKEKTLDFASAYALAKQGNAELKVEDYAKTFITDIRQEKSAERFREENEQFLWVKNIWVTDSPMKHPVESSWSSFKSTHGTPDNDIGEDGYAQLIKKLEYEQGAPNGFFILVVLTAGMSLLMQIVMGKSQKAQMELQTVNGQGAQTQKMMKWMMPIMMAIFAFMYTAAFSLYIIVSNVLSIGTTFGINFIVDRRFKKKEGFNEQNTVIRGRVYTPKEEPEKEPEPKKGKDKEPPKADFLSGLADTKEGRKHIRGRLK